MHTNPACNEFSNIQGDVCSIVKDTRSHACKALRVIIWERQNQLEIEKIDFLEILPIFNFCQEMNKNELFSQFFTSVSMATTIFYF